MSDDKITGFSDLIEYAEDCGGYDLERITHAYRFANEAHDGQLRSSGEPYITHPVAVAHIIIELGMDTDSVVASLLHDVVEDTKVSKKEISSIFGNDIALLVDGVTKLGKIPLYSREEEQAENIRKMLIAMSKDIRVIIIKLADRLHNMRTIDAVADQKKRDKSLETLEVYAPIAHRLGIRGVKEELEDLSIRQLDPIAYEEIISKLNEKSKDREVFLDSIQNKIYERLVGQWPNVSISGRVKSVHGIYRKMYMQGKSFDEIYDVYAVRILTDNVTDCYNILGIIHDMFTPIPGRFKDYISTPKPNMYQSLHTTLLGRDGIPFEVQIRTWEMHQTAEYGVAAHWKYKSGVLKNKKSDDNLAWIRKLIENQDGADDVREIVRAIKNDLSQEDVFVMSPKGDVIILPIGATVIDFAYAIHSAVGNKMIGAKANGRIVPIDYVVKTGEVVEILTTNQQGHGPSRDWLNIVKTGEAKNKIRNWFKKEKRPENIVEGRLIFERELKRDSINFNDEELREQFYQHLCEIYRCKSIEDFYATIGYGGLLMSRLMPRIRDEYNKNFRVQEQKNVEKTSLPKNTSSGDKTGVIVDGLGDCLIHFSHCCNPLPGDDIIGFITRGHGVSVHKRDCSNVPSDITSCEEPDRWISASWTGVTGDTFNANLFIYALKDPMILADITTTLANMHVNVQSINARETKEHDYCIVLTIITQGKEHLEGIIAKICSLRGILNVDRTGNF